eukprot:g19343.t1
MPFTVSFPVEEADVQHGPDGSEVATITSREKKLPTYPSRQVGGRFCLPLTLADDMQHGRGRSSERSGNPPLPPTHVQLPRLPIATVTPSDRKPLPPRAWPVLLLNGVVLAALIGFGYLVFMKFCARPFTFVVPLMLLIADLGGALYFLFFVCKDEEKAAQVLGKFTDHPVLLSQVVGWSLAGQSIQSDLLCSVGCIDCAGDAIWTSPLVRLPSLEILIKTLFSGMWLIFFSFVVSMGQIEPPTLDVNGTPVYTRLRQFGSTPLQKCYVLIYILGQTERVHKSLPFEDMLSLMESHRYFVEKKEIDI